MKRSGKAGVARKIAWALVTATAFVLLLSNCGSRETASPRSVDPPVVASAGDIADCAGEGDEATADLLKDIGGTIITLGDNAYENGSPEDFTSCYDPTWGRFRARTKPTTGNHEYYTPKARGYFGYFGKVAGDSEEGYYSYDLGGWHLIALNSNCEEVGGCGSDSPQGRWLQNDLADNPSKCTLAYFHYPLFTSGNYRPGIPEVKPLWSTLYAAGADVVLNGHDHNYQRFAPQDPDGKKDPERGIREFVVGTGGGSLYTVDSPIENTQVYNDNTYGVLRLILRPGGYDWQFLSAQGSSFSDAGSSTCH